MRKVIALGLVLAFSLAIISPLLAQEMIDLNKASAAQISTLRGVSQKTAAAIVAERTANGPFLSSADCASRVDGLDHETTAKWDSVKCSLPPAKAIISLPLAQEEIDLNKASAAQISTLQGVSQETAVAIVAERTANGPFLSSADCASRVDGLDHETTAKWDSVKCSLPPAK